MAFQLVVLRGRSATQTIRLNGDVTVVGRQDGCHLQIRSSQVSRKHCELSEKDGVLLVKDLGSSNGTFINGKKVTGSQRAEHGMELSFGGVKFRVEKVGQLVTAAAPAVAKKANDTAVADAVELDEDEPILLEDVDDSTSKMDAAPTVMAPPPAAAESEELPEGLDVVEELSGVEDEVPQAGLSEDAVADFLFDIDVDDEDKV
jgi:predicted component of type VI protein secretion system